MLVPSCSVDYSSFLERPPHYMMQVPVVIRSSHLHTERVTSWLDCYKASESALRCSMADSNLLPISCPLKQCLIVWIKHAFARLTTSTQFKVRNMVVCQFCNFYSTYGPVALVCLTPTTPLSICYTLEYLSVIQLVFSIHLLGSSRHSHLSLHSSVCLLCTSIFGGRIGFDEASFTRSGPPNSTLCQGVHRSIDAISHISSLVLHSNVQIHDGELMRNVQILLFLLFPPDLIINTSFH